MSIDLSRTEKLLGREAIDRLSSCRIAVFGLGGVGGYAVSALARSGVGTLDIIDKDLVSPSNINRQIIATQESIGRDKTAVMAEHIKSINPDCVVNAFKLFYLPGTADEIDMGIYDYVIDAVDTVTAKLCIIEKAYAAGSPVISCMGTGDKLDPTAFRIARIEETGMCPLARVMRRECAARGIKNLKVLYSTEKPETMADDSSFTGTPEPGRRSIPGSIATVPSVAGLIIANEVIMDICGIRRK